MLPNGTSEVLVTVLAILEFSLGHGGDQSRGFCLAFLTQLRPGAAQTATPGTAFGRLRPWFPVSIVVAGSASAITEAFSFCG
jgi:hypothetical protein